MTAAVSTIPAVMAVASTHMVSARAYSISDTRNVSTLAASNAKVRARTGGKRSAESL